MKKIKWLVSNIRPIRVTYMAGIFLLISEIFSTYTIVYVQKHLIDTVFIQKHFEYLTGILSVFVIATIVYIVCFSFSGYLLKKNEIKIRHHLVKTLMDQMYKLPIPRYRQERVGNFATLFSKEVLSFSEFLTNTIPISIKQLVSIIVLVAIIGYLSLPVLFIILALAVLHILFAKLFGGKTKELSKQVLASRANLITQIEEGIASTREVVAFHRMEWEQRKIRDVFKDYYLKVIREARWLNFQLIVTDPIRWASNLFILFFCGYQVMAGSMTLGTFVILYQFSSQLMDGIFEAFNFAMTFFRNSSVVDRIFRWFNVQKIEEGTVKLTEPIFAIQFDDVTFSYPNDSSNRSVLRNVSFDIPIGKKVAIVGFSGSGKSTIVNLLMKLYDPTAGAIKVNGQPLNQIHQGDWMERVAAVFQEPYFFPDTIMNNLTMGRTALSESEVQRVCRLVDIDSFIADLPQGYYTEIGERGVMLSGGQRQRLALARALLREPEMVILDEATSALDQMTEKKVLDAIDSMRGKMTMIIIAHRLSTILNADEIIVFSEGRLVERGTHASLMEHGEVYKQLMNKESETDAQQLSHTER